jgi:hypothetical protein
MGFSSGNGLNRLLRVELDLSHDLVSAGRAIFAGCFLVLYGCVIAVSTVALTVLQYPASSVIIVCIGTICVVLVEL